MFTIPPEPARARLVRTLVAEGLLTDPGWRAAFAAVPRDTFTPRFFTARPDGRWTAVDHDDRGWLDRVYSDRVLVTQLDDDPGRWAFARAHGPVTGVPTSSSSQPAITAVMLAALNVADGHRVLEVGTGTGYTAALLAHRLGSARTATVDVDAGLVAAARARLAALAADGVLDGVPVCVAGDGAEGLPACAPFDRVLVTCALAEIPPALLDQTVPGGLLVTTLHRPLGAGLVCLTAGEGPRAEGRVLAEDGRFMPLRAHRAPRGATPEPTAWGTPRTTGLAAAELRGPFEFYAGLALPGVVLGQDDERAGWLVHPDGSWARQAGLHVWQGGPRNLWDTAETAYTRWRRLGRPGRTRFGLTVEPGRQDLWLDRPDGRRWPLRVTPSA